MIVGSLFVEDRDYPRAESHLLDALGQYLDAPHDPQDQAECYVNLARVYNATKRRAQAVTAYNRALDFYQETPGSQRDQSDCYTELGIVYQDLGKLEESAAAYGQAARLRQQITHRHHKHKHKGSES